MKEKMSKSKFKPKVLEYFREIEKTGKELIITDRGRPIIKIVPYTEKSEDGIEALRGTVLEYENPTKPVALEDWDHLF